MIEARFLGNHSPKRTLLSTVLLLALLLLATSACDFQRQASDESPLNATAEPGPTEATASGPALPEITLPEVKLPEVEVPADALATAQAAVQQAGEAAGTAVNQAGDAAGTAVQQAGDLAGTAAVVATEQGGAALATVQAIETPDLTALTERLAAARPDESGNLSVTLNEAELNHLLQLRYLVMSAEPEVRDATVRFVDGAIELNGTIPLPLPVGLSLTLRPLVTDGQLELEILEASLARLRAPETVLGFASGLVSSALAETIGRLPDDFQLQSVVVDQGSLTITGRVKVVD